MPSIVMSDSIIQIVALDQEGRGVGHDDTGKVIFVEGALLGERVRYQSYRKKKSYENATLLKILDASSARVVPRCRYFGDCGGCSMQHLDAPTQIAVKQRVLEDNLMRIGKLRAEVIFRPIRGPFWRYRSRARLAVSSRAEPATALVGFHERKSKRVVEMESCEVLPASLSALLAPLRALVSKLRGRAGLDHIDVAQAGTRTMLLLHLATRVVAHDETLLADFETAHGVEFWLQTEVGGAARALRRQAGPLTYELPESGATIAFLPADFTQVNQAVNRVLVRRCVQLLAPGKNERVADLFCGLGNFTIPLARTARAVLGVDGSHGLIEKARGNASANGAGHCVSFQTQNLFEIDALSYRALGQIDKMLIDPPRDGAFALCKVLADPMVEKPERVVYVSCNPATLARDAAVLVLGAGYKLRGAGIVNMFPHTSHVESIALFEQSCDRDRQNNTININNID